MKKRTVIILTLTIALLFGGCKHQAETSMSALFPSEINSIEVTFDIYPSETTRALNIDEITAVTEWVLALEMEQAPLAKQKKARYNMTRRTEMVIFKEVRPWLLPITRLSSSARRC